MPDFDKDDRLDLSSQEIQLIQLIRQIPWGSVKILIKRGAPQRVIHIVETQQEYLLQSADKGVE